MPQQYKMIKQADGKYTIEKVDVFKLGTFNGEHGEFAYDKAWAERTLQKMQMMKNENDYLAPVIIGHNPDEWRKTEEKPTNGFMDNFSVEYGSIADTGIIYCDIVDVVEADIQDVKDMRFPYRSVEVHPEEGYFCALALLGGTEPYHKLPRMKVVGFAADNKDKTRISFSVGEDGLKFEERKSRFQKFMELAKAFFIDSEDDDEGRDTIVPATKDNKPVGGDEPVPAAQYGTGGKTMPQVKMTTEEREQFKAKHGYDPEETREQLERKNAEAEDFRLKAEKSAAEKFEADLKANKVAPAAITVINDIVKYAKENKPNELQAKVIELVKFASDGKLIVPIGESSKKGEGRSDFSKGLDHNNEEEVLRAVLQFRAADTKLSFEEALAKVNALPDLAGEAEADDDDGGE